MATTYPRPSLVEREPVVLPVLVAFVSAGIGVAAAFGAPLTDEQTTAVLAAVGAAYALVTLLAAFIARRRVTPVADPRDADGVELVPAAAAPTSPARLRPVGDVDTFPSGRAFGGPGATQYDLDTRPRPDVPDCGVRVDQHGHTCTLATGHPGADHWNPYTGASPAFDDPPGRHAADRE